jgi:uncharacterized protein
MEFAAPTPADLETIATQLGRRPNHVVGVATRCPAGHPSVVVNYPVHRKNDRLLPFPTMFWLTCPELVRAVSRLEMRGLIRELDHRLQADPNLAAGLQQNHTTYIAERWNLLTPDDRQAIEASSIAEVLKERGIGGLSHPQSVKCLHLHYAHHLATTNVLGDLLQQEFELHPCPK